MQTTIDEDLYNPKAPTFSGFKFTGWYYKESEVQRPMVCSYKAQDSEDKSDDEEEFLEYHTEIFMKEYHCYPSILYGFYEVDSSSTSSSTSSTASEKDEVSIWGEVTFVPEVKVPMAEAPTVTVPEAPVPLAGPNTGSNLGAAFAALVAGIAGMAYVTSQSKKK